MRVLVFCALLGAVFASPEIQLQQGAKAATFIKHLADNFESMDEATQITTINEFVDMVMIEISNFMIEFGLDPMKMPDIHEGFNFKPIIINYHGELDLTNGWLQDVSTLHRGGDVVLTYENRILKIDIPFAFTDFLFDYNYSIKLMDLGPKGEMDGKVNNIKVFTTLEIDFLNMIVTLKKFDIEKLGKITIKWHGNILLDWLANLMTNITTTLFKGIIKNVAESIIKVNLEKLIVIVNQLLALIKNPNVSGYLN